MIIIGYQGIGKTSLTKNCKDGKYIDLESTNTWVGGKRSDDWYIVYGQMAEDLSRQGYTVFVSSHIAVRAYLESSTEDVIVIYPSLELQDNWINKLENRYQMSKSEKDYKAYMNAKQDYVSNIRSLMESNFYKIEISDMNYDLEALIAQYQSFKTNTVPVKIKRLFEDVKLPTYGTFESAGMDIYSYIPESSVIIGSHETLLIPTGFCTQIQPGYVALVFPRSGMAVNRGINLANCVAVFDSDYRGEWKIPLHNNNGYNVNINDKEKIAQFIVIPYQRVLLEETNVISNSERGTGGFGSTDRNKGENHE